MQSVRMQSTNFLKQIARALILSGLAVLLGLVGTDSWKAMSIAEAEANGQEAAKPTITIDLSQVNGQIDRNAFGLTISDRGNEVPELSHFFRTPEGKQKLIDLGVKTLNYSTDRNHWQYPYNQYTGLPIAFPTWMDTPEYLNLNNALGSDPVISVNVTITCQPTGILPPPLNVECQMATPQLAKGWLSAIKTMGIRPVNYVQLGAEPYAGCQYWQPGKDINCTVNFGEHKIALTQEEYAARAAKWITELRKVNPKVKLGIHLQPNTIICKSGCSGKTWDETLLRAVGNKIDFVIVHQYFQVDQPATTEQDAQRFSYYQEQRDVRKTKNGVTGMPKQIRKELAKWLPSNKNIPIFYGEYNATRLDPDLIVVNETVAEEARFSLYGSMATAEGYLDLLNPVKVGGVKYNGAQRALVLDLNNLPVMLSHYLPLNNPQTLVLSPSWHMFSMLKAWQGKTLLTPKVTGAPKTTFNRPMVRVYAVKQGKNVWIAVFNHDSAASYTFDVVMKGVKPKNGMVTVIGDTASSMLDYNSAVKPNLLAPTSTAIPSGQFKKDRVAGMVFPAHSMTVLFVHGK